MKKELKSGILSADISADCRPTVGGVNVIAVLSMSRFAQPFLFRICMFCAYTTPIYQVSVYRTIGTLVLHRFLFRKSY